MRVVGGVFMHLSTLIVPRGVDRGGVTFWSSELPTGSMCYWSGCLHSGGHCWVVDWLAMASHPPQLVYLQWFSLQTVLLGLAWPRILRAKGINELGRPWFIYIWETAAELPHYLQLCILWILPQPPEYAKLSKSRINMLLSLEYTCDWLLLPVDCILENVSEFKWHWVSNSGAASKLSRMLHEW